MFTAQLFAPGSDVDIALTYYAFVRDEATGNYLDTDSNTFVPFGSLVDGKWPYVESIEQLGEWLLVINLPTYTGVITVLPRAGADDVLLAYQVDKTYLISGVPVPYTSNTVFLHESFGGYEEYAVTTEDGLPLEGVSIHVYTKANYDARILSDALGSTISDYRGYWVTPIPVDAGTVYTLVFSKVGSDTFSVEVVVPAP
jgi:hypothetical protein